MNFDTMRNMHKIYGKPNNNFGKFTDADWEKWDKMLLENHKQTYPGLYSKTASEEKNVDKSANIISDSYKAFENKRVDSIYNKLLTKDPHKFQIENLAEHRSDAIGGINYNYDVGYQKNKPGVKENTSALQRELPIRGLKDYINKLYKVNDVETSYRNTLKNTTAPNIHRDQMLTAAILTLGGGYLMQKNKNKIKQLFEKFMQKRASELAFPAFAALGNTLTSPIKAVGKHITGAGEGIANLAESKVSNPGLQAATSGVANAISAAGNKVQEYSGHPLAHVLAIGAPLALLAYKSPNFAKKLKKIYKRTIGKFANECPEGYTRLEDSDLNKEANISKAIEKNPILTGVVAGVTTNIMGNLILDEIRNRTGGNRPVIIPVPINMRDVNSQPTPVSTSVNAN